MECRLEFGMHDVRLLESETSRPDESLEFGWLSHEVLSNEGDFSDHSLPCFVFPLSTLHYFEHFFFGHGLHFLDRNLPLAGFFFSLLLDHVTQHLCSIDFISIEQVSWNRTLLLVLGSLDSRVLLFVRFDCLSHLCLLLVALLGMEFTLDSMKVLTLLGDFVGRPGFLLSLLFFSIEALSITLPEEIHMIVLRLR